MMTSVDFPPLHAILKNGTPMTLRALRADDRERVAAAVRGLEAQTIYTRLFSHRKELTDAGLDRIMRTDPEREVVVVATIAGNGGEIIIGSGRYVVITPGQQGRAEIAFTVEEDYRGQGVAGRLFTALVDVARRRGIAVFQAEVLADNASMLRVFERSGMALTKRREGDVVHLDIALS